MSNGKIKPYKNLLKYADVTIFDNKTVNVGANTYGTYTYGSEQYQGYTPIGIVGTRIANATTSGTRYSVMAFSYCYITSSGEIGWKVRNISTNSTYHAKIKAIVRVLAKKIEN